jgi:ubiquinone/menaquinone biosynthesis C-methylase UbiE
VDFYDRFADDYDAMTRFEKRLQSNREIVANWIERYGIVSAIDIGCGTGLYAILLAQLGVRSAGADPSAKMLEKAAINAQKTGVDVEWFRSTMQELDRCDRRYDAVFCVGNTLPHLVDTRDLPVVLDNFKRLLRHGGRIVIQLLNYAGILQNRERIVGIHRHRDQEYIRFYDFASPLIRFNILKIRWLNESCEFDFNSTELYPYLQDEIAESLEKKQFRNIETFGDMRFGPYSPESKDVVIVAES